MKQAYSLHANKDRAPNKGIADKCMSQRNARYLSTEKQYTSIVKHTEEDRKEASTILRGKSEQRYLKTEHYADNGAEERKLQIILFKPKPLVPSEVIQFGKSKLE